MPIPSWGLPPLCFNPWHVTSIHAGLVWFNPWHVTSIHSGLVWFNPWHVTSIHSGLVWFNPWHVTSIHSGLVWFNPWHVTSIHSGLVWLNDDPDLWNPVAAVVHRCYTFVDSLAGCAGWVAVCIAAHATLLLRRRHPGQLAHHFTLGAACNRLGTAVCAGQLPQAWPLEHSSGWHHTYCWHGNWCHAWLLVQPPDGSDHSRPTEPLSHGHAHVEGDGHCDVAPGVGGCHFGPDTFYHQDAVHGGHLWAVGEGPAGSTDQTEPVSRAAHQVHLLHHYRPGLCGCGTTTLHPTGDGAAVLLLRDVN